MASYLVWQGHVPGHRYASVQAEVGLTLEQVQAVRTSGTERDTGTSATGGRTRTAPPRAGMGRMAGSPSKSERIDPRT